MNILIRAFSRFQLAVF